MGIITISRQLGAGETSVAPALAARLGWEIADQSIMNREAEITGISLPHALRWDERDPTLLDRLHGQGGEFAAFLNSSRQVMQELAAKDNTIIIGRGGGLLLRGHPNALHVRLIADMPYRIRRVMEVRWIDERPAKEVIAKHDNNVSLFYRHIFSANPNDPMLYDMVLRTDVLGIERIVDILARYFEQDA
ncbi:MAG: cytidylate kinase-like family protein [Capsulimonadaceae bacterium]|nr:cytidylate kinase-like family protein [Capsulimonadaceae bacterium]